MYILEKYYEDETNEAQKNRKKYKDIDGELKYFSLKIEEPTEEDYRKKLLNDYGHYVEEIEMDEVCEAIESEKERKKLYKNNKEIFICICIYLWIINRCV